MLGVLFFAYLVITGQYTVQFGEYRSVYDSAWAGTLMAVCSSLMLTLVGFYLTRGTIRRDRRTEVGQIVAATPMSRSAYILSKFASNVVVLWFMLLVLAVVALVTLLFRNEVGYINLGAFASPFLIIALPATVFVASLAVLFDSIRWLQGSAGNIIYLFLAEMCLVLGMLEVPLLDLGAVSVFTDSARSAAAATYPGERIGLIMGFVGFDEAMQVDVFKTFSWGGIDWTTGAVLLRLFWIGAAVVVTGIAIPCFDRFDPAKARRRRWHRMSGPTTSVAVGRAPGRRPGPTYASIRAPQIRYQRGQMLRAELNLALKGRPWFWYAVAAGLLAAQLVAPFDIARLYLTPALMVWPVAVWSSMGMREPYHDTGSLLFSSPSSMTYQFPAIWLSGLVIALAGIGLMVLRATLAGLWAYAGALLVAALLVPTAALALGTLSGGRKVFEVVYLMVWYIGSIDHLTALDLLGTTDEAITGTKLVVLTLLSMVMLITAFWARRQQMLRS
jgi:hypothetical protein